MRILHRETNQVFNDIEIFLTVEEAQWLSAKLDWLWEHPEDHHSHLETDLVGNKYQKELTVAVYTEDNLKQFDERSRKLILEDK